jgi:hypothetical protein
LRCRFCSIDYADDIKLNIKVPEGTGQIYSGKSYGKHVFIVCIGCKFVIGGVSIIGCISLVDDDGILEGINNQRCEYGDEDDDKDD